ncbi:hypothetical protein Efla_000739 [Eimeria flavescens]
MGFAYKQQLFAEEVVAEEGLSLPSSPFQKQRQLWANKVISNRQERRRPFGVFQGLVVIFAALLTLAILSTFCLRFNETKERFGLVERRLAVGGWEGKTDGHEDVMGSSLCSEVVRVQSLMFAGNSGSFSSPSQERPIKLGSKRPREELMEEAAYLPQKRESSHEHTGFLMKSVVPPVSQQTGQSSGFIVTADAPPAADIVATDFQGGATSTQPFISEREQRESPSITQKSNASLLAWLMRNEDDMPAGNPFPSPRRAASPVLGDGDLGWQDSSEQIYGLQERDHVAYAAGSSVHNSYSETQSLGESGRQYFTESSGSSVGSGFEAISTQQFTYSMDTNSIGKSNTESNSSDCTRAAGTFRNSAVNSDFTKVSETSSGFHMSSLYPPARDNIDNHFPSTNYFDSTALPQLRHQQQEMEAEFYHAVGIRLAGCSFCSREKHFLTESLGGGGRSGIRQEWSSQSGQQVRPPSIASSLYGVSQHALQPQWINQGPTGSLGEARESWVDHSVQSARAGLAHSAQDSSLSEGVPPAYHFSAPPVHQQQADQHVMPSIGGTSGYQTSGIGNPHSTLWAEPRAQPPHRRQDLLGQQPFPSVNADSSQGQLGTAVSFVWGMQLQTGHQGQEGLTGGVAASLRNVAPVKTCMFEESLLAPTGGKQRALPVFEASLSGFGCPNVSLPRLLLPIRMILLKEKLKREDMRHLMSAAEHVIAFAQRYMTKSVSAVKSFRLLVAYGRRFMLLDALWCVCEVVGSAMRRDVWWQSFARSVVAPLPYEPTDLDSTILQIAGNKDVLRLRLWANLQVFVRGARPSPKDIVEIKRELLCFGSSPLVMADSDWLRWKADDPLDFVGEKEESGKQ